LKTYSIQLNIFRPHNIGSHNMRTFEIPAIGGLQLAPESAENREFFLPDSEIVLYSSVEELNEKINWLLENPNIVKDIKEASYKKCLASEYSYFHRSKLASDVFQSFK